MFTYYDKDLIALMDDGRFGESGGVGGLSTSILLTKSPQAHNKEIQVITNLLYIKQTDMTKTIIFFIPQQSEIHLTTRYKVTHRTQKDNVQTVALFLLFIVYLQTMYMQELIP